MSTVTMSSQGQLVTTSRWERQTPVHCLRPCMFRPYTDHLLSAPVFAACREGEGARAAAATAAPCPCWAQPTAGDQQHGCLAHLKGSSRCGECHLLPRRLVLCLS